MKQYKFAEIIMPLPLDKIFHYGIPEALHEKLEPGKRVWVPFRDKQAIGIIVGLSDESDVRDVKEISSVIDEEPIISKEMLNLANWIKDTYLCSWGEAASAMVPGVLKKGKTSVRTRIKDFSGEAGHIREEHLSLTDEQRTVMENVLDKIEKKVHRTFLLHGITGSGKTEIYLQAIDRILKEGRSRVRS